MDLIHERFYLVGQLLGPVEGDNLSGIGLVVGEDVFMGDLEDEDFFLFMLTGPTHAEVIAYLAEKEAEPEAALRGWREAQLIVSSQELMEGAPFSFNSILEQAAELVDRPGMYALPVGDKAAILLGEHALFLMSESTPGRSMAETAQSLEETSGVSAESALKGLVEELWQFLPVGAGHLAPVRR